MHNDLPACVNSEISLLRLLGQLETLAASRDRERLAETVVVAARELLNANFALLSRICAHAQPCTLSPLAWALNEGSSSTADGDALEGEGEPLQADPFIEEALAGAEGYAAEHGNDDVRICFIIGESHAPVAVLDGRCRQEPAPEVIECVKHVLRIYAKHLSLLDYAELDTLTKLHNRKTFDENFDRFIEIAEQAKRKDLDRRECTEKEARPCWLGVVDIDRFKRINDNFGHLFGDEVLLRVAELMKKSFRSSDKLFRFGGEEFVVLLRHVSPDKAETVLNRFREAVQNHEFPQVGQVTCSMGYVEIEPNLTPAEILGKADEALYFSKENGRNQINSYSQLIAKGLLEDAAPAPNADLQADIDALFN